MYSSTTQEPRTVSIPDAARSLGISRATAYRLARSGAFPVPVLKIGARRLVSIAALDRYLGGEAG